MQKGRLFFYILREERGLYLCNLRLKDGFMYGKQMVVKGKFLLFHSFIVSLFHFLFVPL